MKFNLSDFLELDTTALLAVNGGSDCSKSGGYSPSPTPSAGEASTPTGGGGSGLGSGGGAFGGGYCSGASDGKTIYANPYYDAGKNNSPQTSTGGGLCGSLKNPNPNNNEDSSVLQNNKPNYQVPDDPNDYHCDINSYNIAIDNGIQNPGDWDGNALSVNEIYTENYSNFSTEKPQAGTQGYAFYDNDGDGSYDHMYYYDYRNGGSSYHVWNSNGIDSVSESDWSINGTAVRNSVYVPLN